MKNVWESIVAWLNKYPAVTHVILAAWNAFIVSWATKTAVPLEAVGIPITIDATAVVTWLQAHAHIPTAIVAGFTFVLNAFAYYINWKKTHQTQQTVVKEVDTPQAEVTTKTVTTTDVQDK